MSWMRGILSTLLLMLAAPAEACSCGPDGYWDSLEKRIDKADRVALVRIEFAYLRALPADHWYAPRDKPTVEAPQGFGATRYGFREIERFKGEGLDLPVILNENASNCARRLQLGTYVLILAEPGTSEVWHRVCLPHGIEDLGAVLAFQREWLKGVRAYIAERSPIHACDNFAVPPKALDAVCQERRLEQRNAGLRELRPVFAPLRRPRQ